MTLTLFAAAVTIALASPTPAADIVFENAKAKLVLGADARAKSLVIKDTGEECLDTHEDLRAFSVVQDRPFNNEVKLTFPNARTRYRANRLRRSGDRLFVGFEYVSYEAEIKVTEASDYFLFELVDFPLGPRGANDLQMTYPPVDVMTLLDLPVKNRKNFGCWLNALWDDTAAVAVIAAEPYTWIDSTPRHGFRLMTAEAHRNLKLRGAKTALVVSPTPTFLDSMDVLECELGLPRGVQSRRSQAIKNSIYWTSAINPSNVDQHIALAKKGGFTNMLIYYMAICSGEQGDMGYGGMGDYALSPKFKDGYASLRAMLKKIQDAGINPGLHVLQTFIGFKSHYVTPVADPRLNLKCHFTLAKPLGTNTADVFVQEDPSNCPTNERSRILVFGGELIAYKGFTTERPYKFTGITRGAKATNIVPHPHGQIGGILDVCEFGGVSCYIDQNTDLQDEVATKIARLYNCGFRFMYCDGSEGVNVPQGIHVPNAQYRVWKQLDEKPLFMEGAAKAHFGWHHLSGANAFDTFAPEEFKAMIVRWPLYEAPIMAKDFSRCNFGWWNVQLPGATCFMHDKAPRYKIKTIGTQPDMWEFGTSKAAAWDCPATSIFRLETMALHPRADDLLRTMRQWEDVRARHLMTPEWRALLRDGSREFHLVPNAAGTYDLVEWRQVAVAGGLLTPVRAFVHEYKGKRVITLWHTSGKGTLEVGGALGTIAVSNMQEVATDLSVDEITSLLNKAVIK